MEVVGPGDSRERERERVEISREDFSRGARKVEERERASFYEIRRRVLYSGIDMGYREAIWLFEWKCASWGFLPPGDEGLHSHSELFVNDR